MISRLPAGARGALLISIALALVGGACGQSNVRLNEVLANNVSLTNVGGVVTDWVELANPSPVPIDLSDASLSDDPGNPRRFVFPPGSTIPASGLLVVRFDPLVPLSSSNTGFGLKAGGGGLYFYNNQASGGGPIDSLDYGIQAVDFSIGRVPDGSDGWMLTTPTPGAGNSAVTLGAPAALKINEWMAARLNNAPDWFEIFNGGDAPVSLGGLRLTDDPNNRGRFRIADLSFIGTGPLGGYTLFIADSFILGGADHVNFRLEASGEFIGLYDANLAPIDTVGFGQQYYNISQGRLPDGSASRVSFVENPSPGAPNRFLAELTDVVINEVLAHTDPPLEDAVELYNTTGAPIDIGGWYLSDELGDLRRYRIPPNTVIPARGYTVIYEGQFNAAGRINPTTPFTYNSAHGDEVFLTQSDASGALVAFARQAFGSSFNGISFGRYVKSDGVDFVAMSARSFGMDNPRSLAQFRRGTGLPNPGPRVGPLVINEIMYHPPDINGVDNRLDEFIEIRNLTNRRLPLFDPGYPTSHWYLRDAVDFDFPSRSWIAADGIVLVVGFDPADAVALADFRARYGISNSVPVFGPYTGELDNGGESVELLQPDAVQRPPHPDAGYVPYVLVDRVKYKDTAPWPPEADGTGYSLQRKNRRLYGDDPVNWKAGLPTPGQPNGTSPVIVAQPQTQIYLVGSDTAFTVAANGTPPLNYQWRFKGVNLPDATNSTLSIINMDSADVGSYSVMVSNEEESIISTEALLRIDPKSPTLRITSPRPNIRVSNEVLTVQGFVQDNFGVSQVLVSLNENEFQPAQGTTNWSAALELTAGTNTIRAKALDYALNASPIVTLRVFFVVGSALSIEVSGAGSVSPDALNGAMLEVGRGYFLTATPAAGSLLSNWTGNGASGLISSREAVLNFIMQSNLVLQATFVPNPFIPVRGAYTGLFFEGNEARHERSGFFTATITDLGAYSAALQIGTKRFPFSGRFDLSGLATNRVVISGSNALTVDLSLDLSEGGNRISGNLQSAGWTASLWADRAVFHPTANVAPMAGAYTVIFPGGSDPATSPGGDGFGTIRIDGGGWLTFMGVLGDGTKAAQKVPISRSGDWPLYLGLYGGKGSLLGWASVTNRDDSELNGVVSWIKPAGSGKLYPGGFTNNTPLAGSRYARPDIGRVLNLSNAFVTFTGGDLSAPFTNEVALAEDNKVANLGAGKLTLKIALPTGSFSGSAADPASDRSLSFKGVVLQKQNRASGHFLGPTQSGKVSLGP